MTLRDKVSNLVKYCGLYQAHGFMMDERNLDKDFNITLPQEKEIIRRIGALKVIILTGEAGDGKSRILRNIDSLIKMHGFEEPCSDFSALNDKEKQKLLDILQEVIEGKSDKKLVISANVGVFTQFVIKKDIHFMEELTRNREDVFICNFENRNLAEDAESFFNIIDEFLKYEEECTVTDCPCFRECAYKSNIIKILSDEGKESIRSICNAIFLTGGHITFRELLSLLSYVITFGQDCQERQKYADDGGRIGDKLYYNIFEDSDDILLGKVSRMDPAKRRDNSDRNVKSKEEYITYRRKEFFEKRNQKYAMLNVDFLQEFYDVLRHIDQPPYYFDTVKDKYPVLQKLKIGINKMSNMGKSDTGLIVTDTPMIFDKRIKTEFLVMQDISMIWHRYDLKVRENISVSKHMWNKFYLSYRTKQNGEPKLISLLIDYKQFRYLVMRSQDYFANYNELTLEETAVNMFYRKILETRENPYESVIIRFDKRREKLSDFSLKIHSEEDFFSEEKKQTIVIRKED